MDYQVWIKTDYGEDYTKYDCRDLPAARRLIDETVRAGKQPILTVEVPYSLAIKVEPVGTEKPHHRETIKETEKRLKEEAEREAGKSKAEPGEGPGTEGKGKV